MNSHSAQMTSANIFLRDLTKLQLGTHLHQAVSLMDPSPHAESSLKKTSCSQTTKCALSTHLARTSSPILCAIFHSIKSPVPFFLLLPHSHSVSVSLKNKYYQKKQKHKKTPTSVPYRTDHVERPPREKESLPI